jgi:uncharacterized membrane protein
MAVIVSMFFLTMQVMTMDSSSFLLVKPIYEQNIFLLGLITIAMICLFGIAFYIFYRRKTRTGDSNVL